MKLNSYWYDEQIKKPESHSRKPPPFREITSTSPTMPQIACPKLSKYTARQIPRMQCESLQAQFNIISTREISDERLLTNKTWLNATKLRLVTPRKRWRNTRRLPSGMRVTMRKRKSYSDCPEIFRVTLTYVTIDSQINIT